jgi:uncharacterized protein with NAD-binding domain and iron-sulfur cluster
MNTQILGGHSRERSRYRAVRTILVLGTGPAGLAVALRLRAQGYAVTVLEDAPTAGDTCDAYSSLMLPHDRSLPRFLTELNLATALRAMPTASMEWSWPGHHPVGLPRPWLPRPWHLLLGFAAFRGLSVTDRRRLLSWLEQTWEGVPPLPGNPDAQTAEEWLVRCGQSDDARRRIWTPLSQFLVGDNLISVSAASLMRQLTAWMRAPRRLSFVRLPVHSLDDLVLGPLRARLRQIGATIVSDAPIDHVRCERRAASGIALKNGDVLTADCYVSALPHRRLYSLIPERILTHYSYFHHLAHLTDIPRLTVSVKVAERVSEARLILLSGRTFHWLTVKPLAAPAETSSLSLVATGRRELLGWSDRDLVTAAAADIESVLPSNGRRTFGEYDVRRNPHAQLAMRPGAAGWRPVQHSPLENVLVAGEWTDTGLAPSLEGAFVSAERCCNFLSAAACDDRSPSFDKPSGAT